MAAEIITGILHDDEGHPVAGVPVYFTDGPGPLPDIAMLTDGNGEFTLTAPTAGRYTIAYNAEGYDEGSTIVSVSSGKGSHLDICLRRR